jgi:thiosulfate/3-mercaptopyruvate sulfurtransferase
LNSHPSEAPQLPGIVVPPGWLEERLGGTGVRVVDLRDADAFGQGHVPGAAQLDLARLGSPSEGRDNVLLPADAFADLMRSLGISEGDAVIAYDDQWGLAAARLVWALHYYGHTRAAALDGGWDRWTEEARPTAVDEVPPAQGRFEAAADPALGAETDWIADRLDDSRLKLLDTRTPVEFEAGHLPGAHNWDWFNAVPPGSWDVSRGVEELKREWSGLGIEPGDEVVVYCRSGMRAAHTWVAMRRAGYDSVRLYDGSWQEWSMTRKERDGT